MECFRAFLQVMPHDLQNLINITYAAIIYSGEVYDLFLKYCFDKDDILVDEYGERNQTDTDCADFYFLAYDDDACVYQEYIIVADRDDQTFTAGKYEQRYPNAAKTFLTNCTQTEIDGWRVKTWQGFWELLKSELKSVHEADFVYGYMTYLKETIRKWQAEDLSNIYFLPDDELLEISDSLIDQNLEDYKELAK